MEKFWIAVVLVIALLYWFKGDDKNKVVEETCVQETCVVVSEIPTSPLYGLAAYYEVTAIVDAKGYRIVKTIHKLR